MARDDREVIKEFLVSLGFQIETVDARKFTDMLMHTSKLAAKVSATIAGVVVAAEAMTQVFARGMEKMYYASKRTKSSVENLQALEFAFEQVGLTADDAKGTIEAFAAGIRLQPGIVALIEGLGVKVQGRDRVQVLHDTIRQLSKMPHFLGAQYAEQLGIPEHVFQHYVENLDAIVEAEARRREMNKRAGVDSDAAAAAAKRYMQVLRDFWQQIEVLADKMAIRFLPVFEAFNSIAGHLVEQFSAWAGDGFPIELDKWDRWGESIKGITHQLGRLYDILSNVAGMFAEKDHANWFNTLWHLVKTQGGEIAQFFLDVAEGLLALMSGDWKVAWGKLQSAGRSLVTGFNGHKLFDNYMKPEAPIPLNGPRAGTSPRSSSAAPADKAAFMAQLERTYGLPAGVLDAMWSKESNRGRNMTSPKGARGHFQFMPGTAAEYGILGKEDNFQESASAAARYMQSLMSRYGGDLSKSLAAYNWGMGNVDRLGMGRAPAETRDYVSTISRQISINPQTNIYVSGTDPASTGRAVAGAQSGVYSGMLRDTVGALR